VQKHISQSTATRTTNKTLKQKRREDDIKNQKRLRFIIKLRERINQNKFYPNRAIKLNIEGSITVEFKLNDDGSITDIHLLEGNRAFRNSAYKAIKNSAPIQVEAGLFHFPKKFKVTLIYNLQ